MVHSNTLGVLAPTGYHTRGDVPRTVCYCRWTGEHVAESDQRIPKDLDLTTRAPLRIGLGKGSRFTGHLAEIRIDIRALGEQEIRGLARR